MHNARQLDLFRGGYLNNRPGLAGWHTGGPWTARGVDDR